MYTIAIIVLGALCGGFVTGLAGFGTGLTALGFWLYVVDPIVAAALVVICSVVGQVQSLYTVRRAVTWRRVWPFLLGGLVGVPLGVAALRVVDPKTLKILLGLLLVGYTSVTLGIPALADRWHGEGALPMGWWGLAAVSWGYRWTIRSIAHDLVWLARLAGRRAAWGVSTV